MSAAQRFSWPARIDPRLQAVTSAARSSIVPAAVTGVSLSPLSLVSAVSPNEVRYLAGALAPGWSVRQPFPVQIERDDDGSVIVSDDLFSVYGVGPDKDSALRDYVTSLIEDYEIVEEDAARRAPSIPLLKRLQRYIVKA